MDKNYYVYILCRPNGDPFYVGKGKGLRSDIHLLDAKRGGQSHKARLIRKILRSGLSPIIKFARKNLFESDAFELECKLIVKIGRYPNGPLVNQTDGGDGTSGHRHTTKFKKAVSKRNKGNKHFLGRSHSEETKEKMRCAAIGRARPKTVAWRRSMSAMFIGIPKSDVTRKKMAMANRLKAKDPAFRAKLSESAKLAWSKRRAV